VTDRDMLRHTLATLAYRGGKAVRDAPLAFAEFKVGPSTRQPAQILAHIGDLLDWALSMARGEAVWRDSPPLPWIQEVARFHEGLLQLDAQLASQAPLATPAATLFQGPIADALSHVGQLTMLRGMCGAPVRGENYARAEIVVGRVGADQAAARREFD
jgi:hypothetical protein